MRYLYGYKTSDGVRHEGELVAASRESVFKILKAQGIKPYRVELAPGLLNKVLSIGKRGFAIVILSVATIVATSVALWAGKGSAESSRYAAEINSSVRRYPIGSQSVIEKGIRTSWSEVFVAKGDRYLASFAIPGAQPTGLSATPQDVSDVLALCTQVEEGDSLEVRQVKAIVAGIKNEARTYIAEGGRIEGFCKRLVQRQEEECMYYNRARTELEKAVEMGESNEAIENLWEQRNKELTRMGIKGVPMPDAGKLWGE